jgi:Cas7 group CRISPR-associated protein Csh2
MFEVANANPNGDPHTDMPRRVIDGCGWISDSCIKRRAVRDFLAEHDTPEFAELVKEHKLKPDNYWIFESEKRGFDGDGPGAAKDKAVALFAKDPAAACARYFDVRLFGTCLLDNKGKKGEKVDFVRSGAVQISPAFSLKPIEVEVHSGVKAYPLDVKFLDAGNSCPLNDSDKFVRHGLYVCHYVITPGIAQKMGLSDIDVKVFVDMLSRTFEYGRSANRVGVSVAALIHAEHNNAIGSFNENGFRAAATPKVKGDPTIPSASLADYEFPTRGQIETWLDTNGKLTTCILPNA